MYCKIFFTKGRAALCLFHAIILAVLFLPVHATDITYASESGYLAIVGDTKITQADLESEFKALPAYAQKFFEAPGGKARFLDELIKREILFQEALKKGFDRDAGFRKKVEDFKKVTLINQLIEEELVSKTKVTEQDIKGYYDKHKEELRPVSQVRASQILVKTEDEAKKILERLKKGEDFAAIAKKRSLDTATAKKGGDLGTVSPEQMGPDIGAVAIKMKVGDISDPVKTDAGYHIIKMTDKKMGDPIDLEKISNAISQRLVSEKQKETFDLYIESLNKKYKIDVNKEAISKLDGAEQPKETKSTTEHSRD